MNREIGSDFGCSGSIKKIVLVGAGLHYQEKYHEILESLGVGIALLIDLASEQRDIEAFFKNKDLVPQAFMFLEESFRNEMTLQQLEELSSHINLKEVQAVVISTEPKVRKVYTLWAIQQGWDVFMDKPTCAFSHLSQADRLQSDYEEMEAAARAKEVNVVVSCERRAHIGYRWLFEYLKVFIHNEKVPLTGIDISFAGGIWRTPQEYLICENHPFRYGYGILLHSGYHYVDLLVRLLELNKDFEKEPTISIHTIATTPQDHILGEYGRDFSRLLKEGDHEDKKEDNTQRAWGETDLLLVGKSFSQGQALTTFSLSLRGSSLSLRKEGKMRKKLEGKIRQEGVTLHFGHLCSIHIASYPFQKLDPSGFSHENFTITALNSPLLKDKEPIMMLDRRGLSQAFPELPLTASMNGYARQWQLRDFLNKGNGLSSLASHRETMKMIQKAYNQLSEESLCLQTDSYSS